MSWSSLDTGSLSDGAGNATATVKKDAGGKAAQGKARGGNGNGLAAASDPYVIYFCSEALGETAGLGTLALRARMKQKGAKRPKPTVFDSLAVLIAFKKAKLEKFYKVVASKETQALAKKYKVTQDNTLIFCAPNGDPVAQLAGKQCNTTNTLKVLKVWPTVYADWQKKQAKK